MTILEHPEARAILADAVFTPAQVAALAGRLADFLPRFLAHFQRSEQRANAEAIWQGKLSGLSRKTCEPIAHALGLRRESLQDFLGSSPWRDRPLLDELRAHVAEAWPDPDAVFVGDGTAFPKKGDHSCGVKRQHCGRLGKVENCQVGIFLAYSCARGHTLLDHDLFLPPGWAGDTERRKAGGVPDEVSYRETWEILLDQLRRNRGLPHAWFTCDSEFGRVNAFRAALRDLGERFVVHVREDLRVRDELAVPPPRQGNTGRFPVAPTVNACDWAAALPAGSWCRVRVRDGEKGPMDVEATSTLVRTFEGTRVGPVERLVVYRTTGGAEARAWYCLSNSDSSVPLEDVVRAAATRHRVEECFHDAKSEVGMGHYEVRSWRGWHHQMTMSVLAVWFLALETSLVKKKLRR